MRTMLIILAAFTFTLNIYSEPENLSKIKERLIAYHDSGKYSQDLASVSNEALNYLHFRINQNAQIKNPKKLAIVLDIDETSLSNYADLKRLDFGGTPGMLNALENQGHDPAIPSTLALYNYAIANQIAVFFVTERTELQRDATISNLKNAGYDKWAGLYLKPDNANDSLVASYKTAVRKKIISEGYDIAVNIGDQYSDLKGDYADMKYKLVDPYYYVN
ncbi:MAG: hypothetical protein A3F17_00150 [Gammaproteobacteria bacterium RIFCSPHIGHO2_12_FULL_41_15]|nr:MAG: hypothetical protein A3F17_00150 [Gammaproteobacteria bacterium RIFCSPHIGHO2_12_FULL_41_15]